MITNYEARLAQIAQVLLSKSCIKSIEQCIEYTYFHPTNNEAGFDVLFMPDQDFKGGIIFTPKISLGEKPGELSINNEFNTEATNSNAYTTILTAHTHRKKDTIFYNRGPSTRDLISTVETLENMRIPLTMIKHKEIDEYDEEELFSQGRIDYFTGRINPKTIPVPIEAVINVDGRVNQIFFYQLKPGTTIPQELRHGKKTTKLLDMLENNNQMTHQMLGHPYQWNKRKLISIAEKFAESSFSDYK